MNSQRSQSLIEFSLTVGLLMLVVVATAQIAIVLHYRYNLTLATREGAYEASLLNHGPADAQRTTHQVWTAVEPDGGTIEVTVTRSGDLVIVTARAYAPALIPGPVPPFKTWPISARSAHTVEVFTQ